MTGSKAWRGTAKLGCNGCHGYGAGEFEPVAGEPNYKNDPGKENSHQKHTVGSNMADSRGCADCHRTTVDASVKGKLRDYSSAHLNEVRDVSFAVIANYSGHYNRQPINPAPTPTAMPGPSPYGVDRASPATVPQGRRQARRHPRQALGGQRHLRPATLRPPATSAPPPATASSVPPATAAPTPRAPRPATTPPRSSSATPPAA